jgi:hypothetical protein
VIEKRACSRRARVSASLASASVRVRASSSGEASGTMRATTAPASTVSDAWRSTRATLPDSGALTT